MDELVHPNCSFIHNIRHPKSYHSDIKYHTTLNIILSVANSEWTISKIILKTQLLSYDYRWYMSVDSLEFISSSLQLCWLLSLEWLISYEHVVYSHPFKKHVLVGFVLESNPTIILFKYSCPLTINNWIQSMYLSPTSHEDVLWLAFSLQK